MNTIETVFLFNHDALKNKNAKKHARGKKTQAKDFDTRIKNTKQPRQPKYKNRWMQEDFV